MRASRAVARLAAACIVASCLLVTQVPCVWATDAPPPASSRDWKRVLAAAGAVPFADAVSIQADSGNDIPTAVPLPASPHAESIDYWLDPVDVYTLSIPAGQRLRVTLAAEGTGLLADAYLLDQWASSVEVDGAIAGTASDDPVEVFTFDNTTLGAMPCYLAVAASQGSGTYTLTWELFDAPSGDDDDIEGVPYTAPVAGSLDAVTDHDDVFSVEVAAGERLVVDLSCDEGLDADVYVYGPDSYSLELSVPQWGSSAVGDDYLFLDALTGMGGLYYIDVRAADGAGDYSLVVTVQTIPVGAWENVTTAQPIATSIGTVTAPLGGSTDLNDVFRMDLTAGQRVTVGLSASDETDFDLYVYGPNTADIWAAEPVVWSAGWTSDETAVLDVTTSGRYYFEVRAFSGAGSYDFTWERGTTPVPEDVDRLEGTDRYLTAIELSKSVFPAGSCDVAILATGENYPDALAASALAGAHECPILLTRKDFLVSGVVAELDRLGADEVIIIGSTSAISTATEAAVKTSGRSTRRLQGATRYSTAVKIADEVIAMQGSAWDGTAFVVRGDNYADALSAAPIAYRQKVPVLLTPTTSLATETEGYMRDNGVKNVLIAGSAAAVNADVAKKIDGLPSMLCVERIYGADRYATGKALADYGVKHQWTSAAYVGVATGLNFPDALGGGVVCGRNAGVLLLTSPTTLSVPVSQFVSAHEDEVMQIEVFGGEPAVKSTVVNALQALVP